MICPLTANVSVSVLVTYVFFTILTNEMVDVTVTAFTGFVNAIVSGFPAFMACISKTNAPLRALVGPPHCRNVSLQDDATEELAITHDTDAVQPGTVLRVMAAKFVSKSAGTTRGLLVASLIPDGQTDEDVVATEEDLPRPGTGVIVPSAIPVYVAAKTAPR